MHSVCNIIRPLSSVDILFLLEVFHLLLSEFHLLLSVLNLQMLVGPIVFPEFHLGRSFCRLLFFQLHLCFLIRFFLLPIVQKLLLLPQFFAELTTFALPVAKGLNMTVHEFGIMDVKHQPDRTAWSPTRIRQDTINLFSFQLAPLLHLTTTIFRLSRQ